MKDATGTFVIERTTEKRDLGIIITDNLKPTSHCVKAAAKARLVLGVVRRHFKRLDPQDFLIVYKSYIRPHLEYCIQAWSLYLQKDIYCLESVQRAATQLVRGFRNVPYEDRLRILGLTTLAVRIERDLIECYQKRKSESISVLSAFRYYPSPRTQLQTFSQLMPPAAKAELLQSKSDQ